MALTTIINLVLIGIIVIFAWKGFKKGIIMGIIEVLVIILSLYGAQLLSDTFSYEVIPVLKPFVSNMMSVFAPDPDASEAATEAISSDMAMAMLNYMPLRGVLSFGGGAMSKADMQALLDAINS